MSAVTQSIVSDTPGHLVEIRLAHLLDHRGHPLGQLRRGFRRASADDGQLLFRTTDMSIH